MTVLRSYFLFGFLASTAALYLLLRSVRLYQDTSLFGVSWAGYAFAAILGTGLVFYFVLLICTFHGSKEDVLLNIVDNQLAGGLFPRMLLFVSLYLFIFGAIFWFSASPLIYGPTYPSWLVPVFFWVFCISLLTLVTLVLLQTTAGFDILYLIPLLLILTFGILVNLQFWSFDTPRKEDVYYTYLDGARLLEGVNPYERILAGDMQVNDKYSTYLPISYYLSWGTQIMGLRVFGVWLSFWRVILLVLNISIAVLLFYIPSQRRLMALSIFASLFWLFNRWTLHTAKTAEIDFIPLFFMLLSLFLYKRHKYASFLLLGLSLGIKQMAIFLVPLYLIWVWNDSRTRRLKDLAVSILLIVCIPMLASFPFILWNWKGFYQSILFSATRIAEVSFEVYSLDAVIGLRGIAARIPLLIMLLGVYWLSWRQKIDLYVPAFLSMVVFVFFNPVLFTGYLIWVTAFIPLVVYESISVKDMATASLD